jgi:hypothetical protein
LARGDRRHGWQDGRASPGGGATASELLDRARRLPAHGHAALAVGDDHPAVETGWAAAELGIMAQTLVIGGSLKQTHQAREQWFAKWTSRKLRNVPRSHYRALARLAELRPWAPYGVAASPPEPGELEQRLHDVGDLLAAARGFVGEPLQTRRRRLCWWAREELNFRPLPCQARAATARDLAALGAAPHPRR